jgi:hypothetical protein
MIDSVYLVLLGANSCSIVPEGLKTLPALIVFRLPVFRFDGYRRELVLFGGFRFRRFFSRCPALPPCASPSDQRTYERAAEPGQLRSDGAQTRPIHGYGYRAKSHKAQPGDLHNARIFVTHHLNDHISRKM